MNEVLDLPKISEAMTAADVSAHCVRLQRALGPKSRISVTISHDGNGHHTPTMLLYPSGICISDGCVHLNKPDFPALFAAAEAWIKARPVVDREKCIRKLALAIIDITDEHGTCTSRLLRGQGVAADEIAALHEAACERAGEMCKGAPFRVVMDAP